MTTPYLSRDIQWDEAPGGGPILTAYPDPLSGGEPYTIAWGSTGPDIHPGTVWTLAQAQNDFAQRLNRYQGQLDTQLPWWRGMSDARQDVLVNMVWNLGIAGLLAFHNTLSYMEKANYAQASANMLVSKWAQQVGQRATRLAEQMRTGVRAPTP